MSATTRERKLWAQWSGLSKGFIVYDRLRELLDGGLAAENARRDRKAEEKLEDCFKRHCYCKWAAMKGDIAWRNDYPAHSLMPLDEAGFAAEVATYVGYVHDTALRMNAVYDRLVELGRKIPPKRHRAKLQQVSTETTG